MTEEEYIALISMYRRQVEQFNTLLSSLEESLVAQQEAGKHYYALWEELYHAHRRVLSILSDDTIRDHEKARNKAIQVVNDALRQRV